jgi:tRNA A-37 threonylcarbamoyl transferase component Bud32
MIGQSLKNYVIEEMLGKGGMGVVYRARDTRLGRNVALKVLPPELMRNEERRRRFVHEARAAAAVNHPAIAPIYDIEVEGDSTFIVMEFVDGSTVRALVARGELDTTSALEVAIQVGDALARAHEAGIVHRDIKSDNIMVTKDGHPKILDFGLAKLLDLGGDDDGATRLETMAATQAGVVLGTVSYMSPEQARGLPADRRSDIFSLGVVLYEMLTGKLPFAGQSALDTMHAIAFDPTQPLTSIRTDLPFALQRIVDRCLEKKPENRYQNMHDTVADLRSVRREIESGATTVRSGSGKPLVDRVQWWMRGLTARGQLYAGIIGFALGVFSTALLMGGALRPGPWIVFAVLGLLVWRHFRNRTYREMRRFVKKASRLEEVRIVAWENNHLTVVADQPTPRTYLKLNGLLNSLNSGMLRGAPVTLTVHEEMSDEEFRKLLSTSAVQYLREEGKRR